MRQIILILMAVSISWSMTVNEILDKVEANENPETSRGEATQTIYKSDGKTSVSTMISWSADKGDKSLTEYLSPATLKGMKMLMLNDGDDIWTYFPRTGRTRKIASHQKNSSVNGSDFSYEDMSAKDMRKEYKITLAGEEMKNGVLCYKLEMKPIDKDKVYQKVITWVDKEKFISLGAEFYDEKIKLWKVMTLSGINKVGKYWNADSIEMKDVQKESRTVIKMDKVEFDVPVEMKMFSQQSLSR